MMRRGLFVGLAGVLISATPSHAQTPEYTGPVIDMHLHATTADTNGPPGKAMCPGMGSFEWDGSGPWPVHMLEKVVSRPCDNPIKGSLTDEALRDETIAELRKYNARALLGGSAELVGNWMDAAPDLFWPARHLNITRDEGVSAEDLGEAFRDGEIVAISEITNQYGGVMVDDPRMEPFWAMAEREGIPVGVHIGMGPPGAAHLYPDFRVQSPDRLSEVLARHPSLRLFIMHAGYPYEDDLKALLWIHPQLMVDIAVLQFALPRAEYDAFLSSLVRAGFVDRIMFGSDQMNWPGAIGLGIDMINEADYLTYEQKKMILHDNAARFLRLGETEVD